MKARLALAVSVSAAIFAAAESNAVQELRICGCVEEERPTCGTAPGYVTLSPLGLLAYNDPFSREFCFEAVPPGTYTLSFSPRCNPHGCRAQSTEVVVEDEDVYVVIPLIRFTPTPRPTPLVIACDGDCDGSGEVAAGEIREVLGYALSGRRSGCIEPVRVPNVADLITIVAARRGGVCERRATPTTTATATPTPTAPPAAESSSAIGGDGAITRR